MNGNVVARAAAAGTAVLFFLAAAPASGQNAHSGDLNGGPDSEVFGYLDVFELEVAADPQISPDGSRVVYVRRGSDVMTDRSRTALWIINADGSGHRPLTDGTFSVSSPRWSPDGTRLAYVSSKDGSSQIFLRWMDTGQTAELTNVTESPQGLSWSPDGTRLAFTMLVREKPEHFAAMPPRPKGAEWADPPRVETRLRYRADGRGWLPHGYTQIFVVPAEGGTPRQVTTGAYNHGGAPAWSPDGRALVFSANGHEDGGYQPRNSEIYEVDVETGALRQLTDRFGPDQSPVVSPDGKLIAYTGYDDRFQGYQVTHLYVMNRDGSHPRQVTDLDRSLRGVRWAADGEALFAQYDDEGNTRIARVELNGRVTELARNVGGLGLGRPYGGGQYSVARDGRFAYTLTRPDHPADVAVGRQGEKVRRLTRLNDDVLGHKKLGRVEEIWWESSYDGRRVQGWISKPADFDSTRAYPFILEIHGGPFANYGDRFSAEIQLYNSAGYVVLYANPRGSTSYGEEFGNLIHHAYPGHDYDDLMSGVDAVLRRGYIDSDNLMVTGGSGGGVLTAWIVGKTDRFRAAVAAKPVINWTSFSLTSDGYPTYYQYWLPGPPWEGENERHYWARSPLSLVGNVNTPTMLLTGELDLRTPMSETEQFYGALKIRKVPTAMVRIQGAYHGIAARPSNLIAKVVHILEWFDRYRMDRKGGSAGER
ncbi:MAG: prolyl oligopeptidase family serine peptidase [Gemmatimonadota bacterium]